MRRNLNLNLRRGLELALFLLSICAVQSAQPPDHGLSNERDPDDLSPAMLTFFGARPAGPIPRGRNTIDPIWGVDGKVSPAQPPADGRRGRTMLLVAGVACGFIGLGLLVAAGTYIVRIRQTGQPSASQTTIGPSSPERGTRWKGRREIRLGAA